MATPHPKRPDIQPLNKTTSRIFITFLLVLAIVVAVGSIYYIIDIANDPSTQARVDRIQRMEDSLRSAQAEETVDPLPTEMMPAPITPPDSTAP